VRRVRRLISFLLLFALIAVPIGGYLYERRVAARDAQRFPPPGRLIDIGDRQLHLLCIGQGTPTVLFEASGFGHSMSFTAAREGIAAHTRVCSYDRAGVGWSDPLPRAISIAMLADDLRRLQEAAPLDTPFVIVTSSIGGLVTEMFARRYPDRVAGLVYLDAATSEILGSVERVDTTQLRVACGASRLAGRLGIVRLFDPFDFRSTSSEQAERSAAVIYGAQPWNALCAIIRGREVSEQEFGRATPLRDTIPLTVLSAETPEGLLPPRLAGWVDVQVIESARRDAHQRFAKRSARGTWRVVPGSNHLIASSQPQAVIEVVMKMIADLKGS
jgi:pimeloyl-ACP methyl ester carboxylesterase